MKPIGRVYPANVLEICLLKDTLEKLPFQVGYRKYYRLLKKQVMGLLPSTVPMPNLKRKGKDPFQTKFLVYQFPIHWHPFLKSDTAVLNFKKKPQAYVTIDMQKKSSLGHSFTSLDRQKTNHPCLQLYPRFGVISSFFAALARLQAAGLFVEVPYFKVRKDCELSSRNNPKLKLNTSLIFFVCQFQRLEKVKVKVFQSHHGFQRG